jgi:hypothetical protein
LADLAEDLAGVLAFAFTGACFALTGVLFFACALGVARIVYPTDQL